MPGLCAKGMKSAHANCARHCTQQPLMGAMDTDFCPFSASELTDNAVRGGGCPTQLFRGLKINCDPRKVVSRVERGLGWMRREQSLERRGRTCEVEDLHHHRQGVMQAGSRESKWGILSGSPVTTAIECSLH